MQLQISAHKRLVAVSLIFVSALISGTHCCYGLNRTDTLIILEDSIDIGKREGWVYKKVNGPATRYCDGKKCKGWIKDYYENGNLKHKGFYKYGKIFRKTHNYFKNGNLESVGKVDANYRMGKWKYFYENGNMKAFIVWNDSREKVYKTYYENGQLESHEKWTINFYLKFTKYFYETGELKSIYVQPDRKKYNCIEKEYYKNGILKMEGEHVVIYQDKEYRNIKTGHWKYYNEDGTLKTTERYHNGELKDTKKH